MKKFERLSPEERKKEIQEAAVRLFNEIGFKNTTMENIVSEVTLSKGGVYRIYSSTESILTDIILNGMRLRNAFYEERVRSCIEEGNPLTLEFLVKMIGESLLLYPEISSVYVEFLWEKMRNENLQKLYEKITEESVIETNELIEKCGASHILEGISLSKLTELMNSAILSIKVLKLDKDEMLKETENTIISLIRKGE